MPWSRVACLGVVVIALSFLLVICVVIGGMNFITIPAAYDYGGVWSPDGRTIAFGCYRISLLDVAWHWVPGRSGELLSLDAGEICTMDADGRNRLQLTQNRVRDTNPTWSPDGQQIAYARGGEGQYDLYLANADGTGERWAAKGGSDMDWSSYGETIAFSERGIQVVNLRMQTVAPLTAGNSVSRAPRWSPDGRLLAYLRGERQCELWLLEYGTYAATMLTDAVDCYGPPPTWSPDGRRLAFTVRRQPLSSPGHVNQLAIVNLRRVILPLTGDVDAIEGAVVWSREGDKVFYVADGEIHVAQADGSGARQLTVLNQRVWSARNEDSLSLSPNGTELVFAVAEGTRDNLPKMSLWKMNVDGSNLTRLSP